MELLGEEVSQLWGRKHLYIVGKTIQPLPPPPKQPRTERYYRLGRTVLPLISGTTAPPGGTTVESGGQESDRPERYYRS